MLKKFKPLLLIGLSSPKANNTGLLKHLRKIKYKCVLLRLPTYNPENLHGSAKDIWAAATGPLSL